MKLKKMISIMAVGAASMSILAGCQASGTKASNSTTAAAQTEQSSTAEASSEAEKQRITQRIPETAAERHWSFIIPQAETRNVSQGCRRSGGSRSL